MGTYDLFRTIAKSDLTTKECTVEQIQYDILADFYDSPSYQSVTINNTSRDVQITDENAITKNPNKKRVLCKPDEDINIGDDILWNNQHWLCINIDSDKEVYAKGIIEKCNNILTFYKDGILKSIPCIITAIGNSLGLSTDETRYISDLGDIIIVRVPNNSDSQLININQIFKIGKWNFKVQNIADIIEVGLLVMRMAWVANEADQHVYTLEILNGTDFELQDGSTLQLNVNVYDGQTLMNPQPALTYVSNNTTKATVSSTGLITGVDVGSCVVTVSMTNNTLVKDTINISVIALPVDNITVDITGLTVISINQTKNYSCSFKNNGVSYVDTSVWDLRADDGVSVTTLASITIQDGVANTCSVKANNSNQYGYVRLYVRNTGNTVSNYIRIQIKSLV